MQKCTVLEAKGLNQALRFSTAPRKKRAWVRGYVELYLEVEDAEIKSTGRWIGESKSPS